MAKKTPQIPLPQTPEEWCADIAWAYRNSETTMPTLRQEDPELGEQDVYQVAPLAALVFRGIKVSEKLLAETTDYALCSFEANYDEAAAAKLNPIVSFAFCYVGAHLSLKLIAEEKANELMDLVEDNVEIMEQIVAKAEELEGADLFMTAVPQMLETEPGKPAQKKGKVKKGKPGKPAAHAADIYILEISLLGLKPRIWRRVAVPGHFTLAQLHSVIRIVMAWDGDHLHEFEIGNQRYSEPASDNDLGWNDDLIDEDSVQLAEVAGREGLEFLYTYDMGDNWEHKIVVKKIEPPKPGAEYPVCLEGKRAAPPDDSGGVYGYENRLAILADPQDKEYEDVKEWLGEDFDPEAFDLDEINARLRRYV